MQSTEYTREDSTSILEATGEETSSLLDGVGEEVGKWGVEERDSDHNQALEGANTPKTASYI